VSEGTKTLLLGADSSLRN